MSSVRREIKQEVLGLREMVTYPFGKKKNRENKRFKIKGLFSALVARGQKIISHRDELLAH